MQEGVFITPQEAMEPGLHEALIDYESSLRLKAVKIKLSFPQQIVEEREHVRDTTHPPKHYGFIYVTRSLYEVTFPMSYRNVGVLLVPPTENGVGVRTAQTPTRSTQWEVVTLALRQV